MVKEFEAMLRSSNASVYFPKFDSIHFEVPNIQGRADLLAVRGDNSYTESLIILRSASAIKKVNAFKILGLLRANSSRTQEYVISNSCLSRDVVRIALAQLEQAGIITRNDRRSISLFTDLDTLPIELWAFELKLNNWKRALYQALQFKTYADRIITVFPMERERVLINNLDYFSRMGIGVFLFDTSNKDLKILNRHRKTKPTSRDHYFYALSRIVSM